MNRILFIREWLMAEKEKEQKEIYLKMITEKRPSIKEFYRNKYWEHIKYFMEKQKQVPKKFKYAQLRSKFF